MKIKKHLGCIILIIAFVVIAPRIGSNYSQMVLCLSLIHAITALGVSIMLGMGGQLSFASVSFMGLGAFIMANLTSGRNGFVMDGLLALLITIALVSVISLPVGAILFRLNGTYFTFATIGLVQVMMAVFVNYRALSGGPDGISGVPAISAFGYTIGKKSLWFYVIFGLVLIVALIVGRIRKTRLGRSLAAVRDNEIAAMTLGVNVYGTKVVSFVLASAFAALAGALYAMYNGFVSSDLFTFNTATTYIIMVMLGGVNNTIGVIVGALLVTMLPEWLRPVERYLRLFYGIGVIFLMVFMPMGLAGIITSLKQRLFKYIRRERLE